MQRYEIRGPLTDNELNKINQNYITLFNEYRKAGLNAAEAREKAIQALADSIKAREDAEEAREIVQQIIDESFDIGALNSNIEQKLNELEAEYAPKLNSVRQDLAQTEEKTESIGNAISPLIIPSYDTLNSYQVVHPDYKYFSNGLFGYKHWMVHTPYPWTNDFHENPTVVASHDGVNWEAPDGLVNPLDKVTQSENDEGHHFSDAILVDNPDNNALEVWYRWTNKTTGLDRYYRRITTNGVDFSERELVFEHQGIALSPSVILENGIYRMWYVVSDGGYRIAYQESTDAKNWGPREYIPVTFAKGENATIWHIHVFKERSNLYHLTFNERFNDIYWATSTDGKSFSGATKILSKSDNEAAWDSKELYRASLGKVDGVYKLYYSALGSSPGRWYIGLTEGKSMKTLKGSSNYDNLAFQHILRLRNQLLETLQVTAPYIFLEGDKNTPVKIRFLERGVAGASLELDKQNTIKIVGDNGSSLGNISVSEATISHIFNRGGNNGLSLYGFTRFLDHEGESPVFKLLHRNRFGASLTIDEPNAVTIKADNGQDNGHLKAATVWLTGDPALVKNGALRYNAPINKFQALTEGYWHNLNNFRPTPPETSTSPGTTGDYSVDENYMYVCYRATRWIRVPKDPNW